MTVAVSRLGWCGQGQNGGNGKGLVPVVGAVVWWYADSSSSSSRRSGGGGMLMVAPVAVVGAVV